MGGYLPQTDSDKEALIRGAGLNSIKDIYSDIPEAIRLDAKISLNEGISEYEAMRKMRSLAQKNLSLQDMPSFIGAGVYDRYIPSIVRHLSSRSEFYTSYTPYQPEISQGTLTYIFEFQTMAAMLTGLDIANASLYDGPSALVEAALLCCRKTKRKAVLASNAISPQAKAVLETGLKNLDIAIEYLPFENGHTVLSLPEGDFGAVIVQSPNFYGQIEEVDAFAGAAKKAGALMVGYSENPHALAVLKSFGELGCNVACGEMQGFGIEPFFGGPYLGYMAVKEGLERAMPGRVVGLSEDSNGNEALILTLQAREQHIRREKAVSNICTNQSLNALKAVLYVAAMGERGIKEAARQGMAKARYLRSKLMDIGVMPLYDGPFIDEFIVKVGSAKDLASKLVERGYIGGLPVGSGAMLLCATEKRTKEEIDGFIDAIKEAINV